ncbi:MAG: hypothetical protein NTX07_04235, partial [Solirubrobacterales bacterium]|nr:hypothetical protein [Solirubrobacterales bacterium]
MIEKVGPHVGKILRPVGRNLLKLAKDNPNKLIDGVITIVTSSISVRELRGKVGPVNSSRAERHAWNLEGGQY